MENYHEEEKSQDNLNRKGQVIFVVENEEIIGEIEQISSKSPYFCQLISQFTPEQVIYIRIIYKYRKLESFSQSGQL